MAAMRQLEFFLLRYVPDAVKNEFVNIGLVMLEPAANGSGFADVRFSRDWRRVRCLDPGADVEMLEALERDIRARLTEVQDREALLRKLEDSFSNTIQLSPTRACLAVEPAAEIETLAKMYFEGPRRPARMEPSGRLRILRKMRNAFEQAGVWGVLIHDIAVERYTYAGDPLTIDCGYQPNGVIKMFHAAPLNAGVDVAKVLAFSYPQIAEGIGKEKSVVAKLTAVVEDDVDRNNKEIVFARGTLERAGIQIAFAAEMPKLAEVAKSELRA